MQTSSVAAKIQRFFDKTNFLKRKSQKVASFYIIEGHLPKVSQVSHVVQARAEGPKTPSLGQHPGY